MEKVRKILVIVGGISFLLFGLYHLSLLFVPEWKSELVKLAEVMGNMVQLLNVCLSVFLLAFGFLMLIYRKEILSSKLGRALLIVFSLFWFVRFVGEFVFPCGSVLLKVILFLLVLIYLIPVKKQ